MPQNKSKQEVREDKRRILKLILESPMHYRPEDLPNVFYGEIEQEVTVMLGGRKKISLQEFQHCTKEIPEREEYISRLIQDLREERILGTDSHNKLLVKNPDRAIERYLQEYEKFYRGIHTADVMTGKIPRPGYKNLHRHNRFPPE